MAYRRAAFTLVELLVVIATIAVIAGLLFPVLLDARKSAQQTRCSSNFRSAGMAISLYASDHDDMHALAAHRPGPEPGVPGDRTWVQLMRPYVGNTSIYRCPSDSYEIRPDADFDPDVVSLDAATLDYRQSKRTNLGLNYLTFAPIVQGPDGRWRSIPIVQGSVSNPASTLLLVDSVWRIDANGRPTGGGHYLVMQPCRYTKIGPSRRELVDVPTGFRVFLAHLGWEKNADEFRTYGGAYPWHDGRMTTLFSDGHVKPMTPEQLSDGCDLRGQWSGEVFDSSRYIWDAR